jgi:peptide/nickel transport system permease protein
VSSAYFGGAGGYLDADDDIMLSFPDVLALVVVGHGPGIWNVIRRSYPDDPARRLRQQRSGIAPDALCRRRKLGASDWRIIFRHMLPNVMAPYLIMVTAFLGQAILLEASLSFLGLGVAEPTAAWGLMLRGAAVEFAERAPWMALFPGLAISLAVFAFNIFGDSLRDALDPKLRVL